MDLFPSLTNVDEFISDYFFTSSESKGKTFQSEVKNRIKEWKSDPTGALTPLKRLSEVAVELQKELVLASSEAYDDVTDRGIQLMRRLIGVERGWQKVYFQSNRGVIATEAYFHDGVLAVEALMPESDAPEAVFSVPPRDLVTLDEKPVTDWSVAKLIGELYVAEPIADPTTTLTGTSADTISADGVNNQSVSGVPVAAPDFIVVVAGGVVYVTWRDNWHVGRYLTVEVLTALERGDKKSGGEQERMLCAIAIENFRTLPDGSCWWKKVQAASIDHAVSVSATLRLALRDSIGIIGNDVLFRRAARGLPVYDGLGDELTRESLRYLYRILFLLFAEASPELGIVPIGEDEYDRGYGLSRLRSHLLKVPGSYEAANGQYIYDSIQVLCDKVNHGHQPREIDRPGIDPEPVFEAVEADLFNQAATPLINEVGLSNAAMVKVLENLMLSPEVKGRDRGFISYATLGVTELGQVYEGLMSFKGFIAKEDLYEVAKDGDASKGSWVIPISVVTEDPDSYPDKDLVSRRHPDTGELHPVVHPRGSFVYRQSARDRERSASFYTPPVLSEFVVSQALEELQANGRITRAEDILTLAICEPAMGSGAFGVEAVRQLADLYVKLRQEELGENIPPEDYVQELQKIKAYLALHNTYGVDLNATAVELGEISLWLDSMTKGLKAPWFGLHLRHGNSLVGAMRSTYTHSDAAEKRYLSHPATPVARTRDAKAPAMSVYQFLLPSPLWGAVSDSKEIKKLLPAESKALKSWAKSTTKKLTTTQLKKLAELTNRVDELWRLVIRRLELAEAQVRREINIFGHVDTRPAKSVSRAEVEATLNDPESALQRLKLVMDAWCALMYWPVHKNITDIQLPDVTQWIEFLTAVLGAQAPTSKTDTKGFESLESWDELNAAESFHLTATHAASIEDIQTTYPWVREVRQLAEDNAFFHWELMFAPVFADGGFDLIVGNPPWVRPDANIEQLMAEHDPWWVITHKPTQAAKNDRQEQLMTSEQAVDYLVAGLSEVSLTSHILSNPTQYPYLVGLRPDLYRGFMERTWTLQSDTGVTALIHPESHFTDAHGANLREATYVRLRRHFQFINELSLFDIDHHVDFGVHLYGQPKDQPDFINISHLFHPQTAAQSFRHDGMGNPPGLRNREDKWDLRPHARRIQHITPEELGTWDALTGDENSSARNAKLGKVLTDIQLNVLNQLTHQPRIKQLELHFSSGWNETIARKDGYFEHGWAVPDSWDDVILQGPHLTVSHPLIKQPNPTLKHNQDWSEIDLEAMPADFIPATAYQPNKEKTTYRLDYTTWDINGEKHNAFDYYRVAWRSMAATTGFRTLYPAVIPPGAAHVNAVFSMASIDSASKVLLAAASMSSILSDFQIRSLTSSSISTKAIENLPLPKDQRLIGAAARLHCVTETYAPLWEEVMGTPWTVESPARNALERYLLQVEIDVLCALDFGISIDELCDIYRTQFAVMAKYDRTEPYDANGRKVPGDVLKAKSYKADPTGLTMPEEDRTWTHPQSGVTYVFEAPFVIRDREADMRSTYERFSSENKMDEDRI